MPKPLPTAQIRDNDWANAGTKTAQLGWAEDELFFSLSQLSVALVCQTFCDKMVCVWDPSTSEQCGQNENNFAFYWKKKEKKYQPLFCNNLSSSV